ncbi:MAG: hypothetical protein H6737_03615 [Alphaproteobacteria bacterium]|nr:hypothetical protein [Alphaproteobacteria bacterium]
MLPFLALTAAFASEIQVSARSPVVVAIDGSPAGIAGTLIDTKDLAPGPHRIQIRSFMGAVLAEAIFDLGEDERLRVAYDRATRTVAEIDRLPLSSPVVPEPEPAPEPRPVPKKPDVQLADSPTASLVITGLSDISGEVRIAGVVVPFDSTAHGFQALGQEPPAVEVHIQDNGKLRYHGGIELTPGGHSACHLHYRETAWTVECEVTGPEVPAAR